MTYAEEDYLQLSGIQHYCFCKRQWALIHIEQLWENDARTVAGNLFHSNADKPGRERRNGTIISRSMPVSSSRLGLSGKLDVVEFEKNPSGLELTGEEGRYIIKPVEYKVGHKKNGDWDNVQLCAEAMALEETFTTRIDAGFIYYGMERRRTPIEFTNELRSLTESLANEMHDLFRKGAIPQAKYAKSCEKCSLYNHCMPEIGCGFSVGEYLRGARGWL